MPPKGTLSTIPAIDLTIEQFSLYGQRLGSLRLVGQNSNQGQAWSIEQLTLSNPHAEFQATGVCRFADDPGVSMDATLKIADLGELSAYVGHPDRFRKGRGELTAKIDWRAFPWRVDYAELSGQAKLDLEEGIFDHVNSNAARLLELLSIQSLTRIFSLNLNPDETFEKGFPWNSIRGTFDITQGIANTQDLLVISPVATISMRGGSNLVTETWNLRAEVKPNLDMSGAALATGFLVNPLVGLSAMIGQFLLRKPIETILSERYEVSGPWTDPKIAPFKQKSDEAQGNDKPPNSTY